MVTTLILCIAQLGMGAGAWRLANQLKFRVDDHEARIKQLETPSWFSSVYR